MTETKPKRRWFRFSLATFVLTITAICAWLGWEANCVAERRAMVKFVLSHAVTIIDTEGKIQKRLYYYPGMGVYPERIPRLWLWMGAKPIQRIAIPKGEFSDSERMRISAAFPELGGSGLGLEDEK